MRSCAFVAHRATRLLVALLLALFVAGLPALCLADVIDPETGEYGGGHIVDLGPEIDPPVVDPNSEPEPTPEPVDQDGLPLLPLGIGAVVLAAGATVAIVRLSKQAVA